MNKKYIVTMLCLWMLVFLFGASISSTLSAAEKQNTTTYDQMGKKAEKYYAFRSWPKPSKGKPCNGLKVDDLKIPGFTLVETRFYSPKPGFTYIWKNKNNGWVMDITVNVCDSSKAAYKELLNYFAFGTTIALDKLKKPFPGSIAFGHKTYPTIAFVRKNVKVIIHARTRQKGTYKLLEQVASLMDKRIRQVQKKPLAKKMMKTKIRPFKPAPPFIAGKPVKMAIQPIDAKFGKTYFSFRASGGNILMGKKGKAVYYPKKPGKHTIKILTGNQYNVVHSEKIIIDVKK